MSKRYVPSVDEVAPTRFYQYNQNNSGGWLDEEMGCYIFIEAHSAAEADEIAESIGIYFDGCADGRDCPCCGDRWNRTYDWNDTEDECHWSGYGESVRIVKI